MLQYALLKLQNKTKETFNKNKINWGECIFAKLLIFISITCGVMSETSAALFILLITDYFHSCRCSTSKQAVKHAVVHIFPLCFSVTLLNKQKQLVALNFMFYKHVQIFLPVMSFDTAADRKWIKQIKNLVVHFCIFVFSLLEWF